jgi:hypothetical protein
MKLKHLTDETLLMETERLVRAENEILTTILHHLKEIERRRLYSALKYASLFAYAVEKLGYAADQAYRRIAAMRLLSELPEVEEKVAEGSLSLTTVTLARTAFRKKECTRERKMEVLKSLENKSTREAEKILANFVPPSPKPDKVRAVAEEKIELRLTANASLQGKIEKLKGLLAHKYPGISLGELLENLCNLGLETWGKEEKIAAPQKSSRTNQAGVRRAIWTKARSQCEHCGSSYALEIDHKNPKAKGGTSTEDNLRLLCRSCNQRAAIEAYGIDKMTPFLQASKAKAAQAGGLG